MKLTNVSNLKGGEFLARPIKLDGNTILIYEGTPIKKEYINQLLAIGIENVYIKEDYEIIFQENPIEDNTDITERVEEILRQSYIEIRELFQLHTYDRKNELKAVVPIAKKILDFMEQLSEEEYRILLNNFCRKRLKYDIWEHCIYVAVTSLTIAKECNLEYNTKLDIAIGSLLHDIGFRYISSDYYINHNINELEPQQAFEYKKHAIFGYTAIEDEDWLSAEAKMIVLFHHEKIDGSGFPLKQKKLSLASKIVSICDELDSMITGIGYKRKLVSDAIKNILNGSGSLFDRKIVNILVRIIPYYPNGSFVKTNTNEIAVVVKQNSSDMERPILRYIKDCNGKVISDTIFIDLLKEKNIVIQEVLAC